MVTGSGYAIVSLLTDYGLDDGFVASVHGVIAGLAPDVRILDVTHLVPPGDVRRGALILAQTVLALPPAVHVAVVDPGVGTQRRGVALAAGASLLVGPDNGLLGNAAVVLGGVRRAVALTNPAYWRHPTSATFHGRDIFAPVAAHLATGMDLAAVGAPVDPHTLVLLPEPVCVVTDRNVEVEVLTIDRFGNVQLALPADQMPWQSGDVVVVTATARRTVRLGATFGDVPTGELVAYVDSAGFLALAVNGGRAVDLLGLAAGDLVHVRR